MLNKENRKKIFWFATIYTLSLISMSLISILIHYMIQELK